MNVEVIPAAIAVCGGSGLVAGIYAYERRRDAAMRASRVPLALRFPAGLDERAALAALRHLTGLDAHNELVLELRASAGQIRHTVLAPADVRPSLESGIRAALPGSRVEPLGSQQAQSGLATLAVKLYLPTPLALHAGSLEQASHAVLAAVAGLAPNEEVVLRWALSSARPRPLALRATSEDPDKTAAIRAWERKTRGAGLRAAGLVLVQTGSRTRARALAARITNALKAREERHGTIRTTTEAGGRRMTSLPRISRGSGWLTIEELLPLLGWPLGEEPVHGLERGGARERLVPADVVRQGRRLFVGRDVYGDRLVALTPEAARHHMVAVGPSGSGKSVLIGRSILDDLHAGHGGVVIDPKADLIDDVLNRVQEQHAERVVVLDPADSRAVPGVDVLGAGDADLRTDVLVGALAAIFKDSFGIRSQIYLRLGLRTLADIPGATIADLATLFFDPRFRARAVRGLKDPVLRAQWQAFEALSPTAQAEHVQSPLSKVSALVSRPAVRSVLAAPRATVDIADLLAQRRWLFVSLSPGRLGEPASKLLGAVLLYAVWSAIEGRAALAPEQRAPVYLYIDELATVAALPFGLELLLERARGLGAGVVVALQSLARLPESVRAALLGNAATLITFRASADEANRLARELPGLDARDLLALGRFEVAARIGIGAGSAVQVITGRTEGWPEPTGLADHIRDTSSARYGVSPEDASPVEVEPDDETLGRSRRQA